MTVLIKILQFVISLSILVIIHELGHFIFAKIFKTRVEKFYLFFDPWFSLFKFRRGETEYGVGWLPLGGYVKISGMIDESMDTDQMNQPPQPWEFRSKKSWQRLLIMTGGVLFNNSGSQTSSTSSTTGVALSPEIPVSYDSSAQAPVESVGATTGQVSISASAEDISKADSDYKAAYQNYLSATREGNAEKINAAKIPIIT